MRNATALDRVNFYNLFGVKFRLDPAATVADVTEAAEAAAMSVRRDVFERAQELGAPVRVIEAGFEAAEAYVQRAEMRSALGATFDPETIVAEVVLHIRRGMLREADRALLRITRLAAQQLAAGLAVSAVWEAVGTTADDVEAMIANLASDIDTFLASAQRAVGAHAELGPQVQAALDYWGSRRRALGQALAEMSADESVSTGNTDADDDLSAATEAGDGDSDDDSAGTTESDDSDGETEAEAEDDPAAPAAGNTWSDGDGKIWKEV